MYANNSSHARHIKCSSVLQAAAIGGGATTTATLSEGGPTCRMLVSLLLLGILN